ncbi:MAG: AI-2E family transporter [Anaerolineae bacterium]
MIPWYQSPNQRYRVLLVGVLLLIVLVVLWVAWTALLPFFLGTILAYLLLPIVNLIDRRTQPLFRRRSVSRPFAIFIVYIIGLALVAGVLAFLVPTVADQAGALVEAAPAYWERLVSFLGEDVATFLEGIPPEIQETVNANIQRALAGLVDALQTGLLLTISSLTQTITFVIGLVIVPFWLFLVLNDSDRLSRGFYELVPEKARRDVQNILTIIDELLSSYVRGQALLAVIVGVSVTIALMILGVDLALLLGTVAGLFEVIPILGPWLGAIPAVLIALLANPMQALWVAVAFFAIQQIENALLVPRIAGNSVRFHPALVMVIVIVGSEAGGFWGLLLAVPLAAMLRDVFQYLYLRTTERGATPNMALEVLRAKRA